MTDESRPYQPHPAPALMSQIERQDGLTRPRIADFFCGAGGAAMGYYLAGCEVVGFDIAPQPNYPFEFHQIDALTVLAHGLLEHAGYGYFDAIHASPVCRDWTTLTAVAGKTGTAQLLVETLRLVRAQRLPFVVENVAGARSAMGMPSRLCGSSFGLGVRRHRLFETSWHLRSVPPCLHGLQPEPVDVTGTGASRTARRKDGNGGDSRKPRNLAHAREAMGIDWMSREELSQANPAGLHGVHRSAVGRAHRGGGGMTLEWRPGQFGGRGHDGYAGRIRLFTIQWSIVRTTEDPYVLRCFLPGYDRKQWTCADVAAGQALAQRLWRKWLAVVDAVSEVEA